MPRYGTYKLTRFCSHNTNCFNVKVRLLQGFKKKLVVVSAQALGRERTLDTIGDDMKYNISFNSFRRLVFYFLFVLLSLSRRLRRKFQLARSCSVPNSKNYRKSAEETKKLG